MESSNSPNKAIIGIIIVALLAVVATALIIMNTSSDSAQEDAVSTTSQSPAASPVADSTATEVAGYKDGTYSADGTYQTPGGRESVGVTVTLAGDTITSASVQQKGERGESKEYQGKFASGFASQVVGKSIDEVSLTRVAGSSLTPNGFNNAIDIIKQQAES